MKHFYISFSPSQEYTAWYKLIIDIEYFLNTMGFQPIPIDGCIKNIGECLKNFLSTDQNDKENTGMIVVQFPRACYEELNLFEFAKFVRNNYKNYKIAALVHDLDSVRYGDFFITNQIEEVPLLNQFDYVISQNEAMTAFLKEYGLTAKVFTLNLFDYVLPLNTKVKNKNYQKHKAEIAYTGNLKYDKSAFLYELDKVKLREIKINLYGPGLDYDRFHPSANIKFKGEFPPDDLVNVIYEGFGLCWDGDSLERCGGKIGEYMKYINPHKASFYLSLGIPLVISKDIAVSAIIKQEHAGVIIETLYDLPDVINGISNKEYRIMRKNALKLSQKVKCGYYMKQVIQDIEKSMQPEQLEQSEW